MCALSVVGLMLVAGLGIGAPRAGALLGGGATIEPLLATTLTTTAPTDRVQAVAVFSGEPSSTLLDAVAATGVTSHVYSHLTMAGVEGTPTQINALAGVVGVSSLWANRVLQPALGESAAYIQATDVSRPAPDGLGYDGSGVGVAAIDSGIDGTHPGVHYPEKTVQNVKFLGVQRSVVDLAVPVEDVPDTDTSSGHGSHVAGIIAGTGAFDVNGTGQTPYIGVAPGADLIGVGAAEVAEVLTALAAYDWVLENRQEYNIRVLNNSWADGTIAWDAQHPLNVASKTAHDAGITVVMAGGNNGQASGDVLNRYSSWDWVITVAGGDKLGRIGDYSSRGSAEHHPDVVAPGSYIASVRATWGNVTGNSPIDATNPAQPVLMPLEYQAWYTYKLGTSMAAPHVAGVVALMLDANPDLTPDQIRSILIASATPMPGCPTSDCGAGYVNALAAVQGAVAAVNRAPVAALVATPSVGEAPLAVTLDGSGSTDADGSVSLYRWDFEGDGEFDAETTSPVVGRTYDVGVWEPTLVVVDDDGRASAPAISSVRASDPPLASASAPKVAQSGEVVTFDGSASSDPDGSIVSWEWDLDGDGTVDATGPTVTWTYARPQHSVQVPWRLVVTDDAGLTDAYASSIRVTPAGPPS